MRKFLAVVKREYVQRVRSRMFVVMTVLGPLMLVVVTIVPGLLFTIKTSPTRLAIVDQTEGGKLFPVVRDALLQRELLEPEEDAATRVTSDMNSNTAQRVERVGRSMQGNFELEQASPNGQPIDTVRANLNRRIGRDELDGYLVIPADILTNIDSEPAFYGRNVSDMITRSQIASRLDWVIKRQRLIASGVTDAEIATLSKKVKLQSFSVSGSGEEGRQDSGMAGFAMVFIIAFLIYITVLLYGQVILGAVVEEKETRIAEILFSSVKSYTLMLGKLVGVSLVALTQMAIWGLVFFGVSIWGVAALSASGFPGVTFPSLPPFFFVYFLLFFMLGYFIYATIYLLIGSMVTTAQEGGQLAMPIVFLLMAGLYMAFAVMRSPNSTFSVIISMVPLFSPITMMVRIVGQTPPVWQILLSLFIGVASVLLLLWLASRVYRIGMLMYGKRATIPEVMRWVRQQ
jgi:ABC-2 type transport system permease protein